MFWKLGFRRFKTQHSQEIYRQHNDLVFRHKTKGYVVKMVTKMLQLWHHTNYDLAISEEKNKITCLGLRNVLNLMI